MAKKKKKDESFKDFVLEQLESHLDNTRSRAMFGGWGLYWNDLFFAVVDEGRAYFKTDEATRAPYEAAGMGPFEYAPGQVLKNYYEVPLDVLEDSARLAEWAKAAAALSAAKPAKPKAKTSAKKSKNP